MGTLRLPSSSLSTFVKTFIFLLGLLLGQDVFAQIAQQGSATTQISTSASVTVTKPTGVVQGDIMIANVGNYFNGTNNNASSTGWTVIAGTSIERGRATLLYKIAGASEPADYAFSVTTGSTATAASIVAFSGVNTTTSFDVTAPTAWTTTSTSSTINNLPSITTVTAGAAVLAFGASSRITPTTATNFTSWTLTNPTLTEIFDVGHNGVNSTVAVGGAWGIRTTAGSTGAGGFTCSTNTNPRLMGGIMIALRPCVTNTAGTASSNPTLCINTALTNITRTTTGATGIGTPTGLPAGVTASWASNVLTISGTPTASGTFNYSIPLTGGCGSVNATGSITVTPNNTIALSSAAGTNAQTGCVNTAITNITYATTTATGATVSGLPTGVSGSWSSNVFTITGTPSVTGTFNYTVTMTGGCTGGTNTATGSITVQDGSIGYANLQFPATQSVCIGNNFTAYGRVYALGVTEAAGANAIITAQIGYNSSNTNPSTWPAGNWSAATYSVQSGNNDEYQATLGSSLTAGTYYYTFRFSRNGCAWVYGGYSSGGGGFWNGTTNVNGVFTINPNLTAPTAGNNSRCGAGSVTISAVAGAGETIDWYAAATGGSPLSGGTGTSSFNTPSISTNTTYYAAARNTTTGCSSATRTAVVATVLPVPTGVSASVSPTAICQGASVALSSSATSNSQASYVMLSESFNAANPAWTTVNNSTGGTPNNAAWTIRANNYNNGTETFVTPDVSSFMFSDSDAQGNGSTTDAALVSPSFSTVGVAAANINLSHYFRFNASPDKADVDISLDGTTWTTLTSYTSTQGVRNAFASSTIALTGPFLNQPTVYIRLRLVSPWGLYWAVNSVTVTAASTAAAFNWTSAPAGFTSSVEDPTGVVPTATGTYTVTATNNFGCSASATTATVTVTSAPAAPASAGNSRCGTGIVNLIATVAGGNTVDWYAAATGGSPLAYQRSPSGQPL